MKLVPRSAKLAPRSKFNPIKMLLPFPLFIMIILINKIVYWNYDKYSDLRKRFKGYRNVLREPFEIKKHNFIIYGPSNSGKTNFIEDYCGLWFFMTLLMYSVLIKVSGRDIMYVVLMI